MTNGPQFQVSFADFIEGVAQKAGLIVQKQNPNLVTVLFDQGEGRKQTVWVKPKGKDFKGNVLVGFSSPALKMPKGQKLNGDTANELLRSNATLAHGAWAVEQGQDGDYLVMHETQIAATMQPEEFEASVRICAAAADEMEKKLGVDMF